MATLSDLTSRDAVLKAIEECDDLGRDAFLSRYGFGKSRSYVLIHQDKHYDSKAIAGVALKYEPGIGRPLRSDEFSGGASTVQAKLEDLGFVVRAFKEPLVIPGTASHGSRDESGERDDLVLTAPDEEFTPGSGRQQAWDMLRSSASLEEFADKYEAAAPVAPSITPSNFLSWLERSGRAVATPSDDEAVETRPGRGRPPKSWESHTVDPQAPVGGYRMLINTIPVRDGTDRAARWPLLVEFSGRRGGVALLDAALKAGDFKVRSARPMLGWCAGAGFVGIGPTEDGEALLPATDADEEPFDPANQEDARDKVLREIRARRGQRKFRDALVSAYAGRCAVTGCSVLDVLEAAHITPYLGPATNHVTNGLLLRADLHTLFDTLLLAVDPDTLTVLVAPGIDDPAYRNLHGKALRDTLTKATAPSLGALKQHRSECQW